MQQTTNYNLNKFDSTDELEDTTRLGLNENADTIDTALKGIQDDIDGLDASGVPYDNTVSGLTATDVQAALDEELDKIDILSTDYIVEEGTDGIWTYRKWNSGIAECWGKHKFSNIPATAWGNIYMASCGSVNFPAGLFNNDDVKCLAFLDAGPNGYSGMLGYGGSIPTTKDHTPDFMVSRGTQYTGDYYVTINATGTWK